MQIITILIMSILVGAEIDLFVPSFPELKEVFSVSTFMVELTIAVNLIAHCIVALFIGVLGDKYGRKNVILIGLVTFVIGSILCVFAQDYWHLLFGRILQGAGISAPAVLAFVIVADMYSVKKQQHIMGVLNGIISGAMAMAPLVGSYVNLFFDWRGNFVLLLALGFISLVLCLFFIKDKHQRVDAHFSLKEYMPILQSKRALLYIVALCFMVQPYWVFVALSPILYMNDLGVSLQHFGFYQGAITCTFTVISLSSAFFIKRFGSKNCFFFGIYLMLSFLVGAVGLVALDVRNPMLINAVIQILSVGIVFPINMIWPVMLETVKNSRAKLSAIFLSLRLLITGLNIQLVGYLYSGSFFYIGIVMISTLSISLICCYKILQKDRVFDMQPSESAA